MSSTIISKKKYIIWIGRKKVIVKVLTAVRPYIQTRLADAKVG